MKKVREMLVAAVLGAWVRGAVLECEGKDFQGADKIVDSFCAEAVKSGFKGLVKKHKGKWVPRREIEIEVEGIMEHFLEDRFWEELEGRLAQRDWKARGGSIEEQVARYAQEFSQNGLDRLRLDEPEVVAVERPVYSLPTKVRIRD